MSASPSELVSTLLELEALDPSQARKLAELAAGWLDTASAIRDLTRRGWLTPFQANLLNRGNGKDLLVGPYLLLSRLGDGGMGEVFRARHRHIRTRVVALKVIRPDHLADPAAAPHFVARFLREPEAVALLSHPNVVKVFDAGVDQGRYYMVMEYLEGTDLARLVKNQGPVPADLGYELLRQAALGLEHLNERGLVHRDIKPANLFLTGTGPDDSPSTARPGEDTWSPTEQVLKILDLGLALQVKAAETVDHLTVGGAVGTPLFMAPEQAVNPHGVDIRADLYSLGRTFFYVLTGKPPPADHRPITVATLREFRPEVPAPLSQVVCRLTARDAGDRFQTPAELLAALGAPQTGRPQPPVQANRLAYLAAGGGVLVVAAVATWAMAAAFSGKPAAGPTPAPPGRQAGVVPKPDPGPQGGPSPRPDVRPEPKGALGQSRLLTRHTASVWGVAFVPGKDQALSCSHSETILWDLKNDSPLRMRNQFGTRHFEPMDLEGQPGFGRILDPDDLALPTGVAAAPDGKSAAFGTTSGLTLWDLGTWKKARAFKYEHCGVVNVCVAYSPDGRRALYANHSNVVHVYDAVKQVEMKVSFPGWVACFSPDGSKVLTGDRGQGPTAMLHYWDVDRQQRLKSFGTFRSGVNAVAIAPNGKQALAAGSLFDHEAILWDLESFTETRRLKGHGKPIRALAFSPDGKRAVTGSEDGTARLWDVATGTELDRFTQHTKAVTSVAFSPGGGYVLTGGEDQGVGVWPLKPR